MTNRDPWTARLSEYVDGELAADERVALERHLAECAECRAIAADLGRVRDDAAALTDAEPPRDLWPAISARIGGDAAVLPFRRRWVFTLPQLAAAAVILVLLGAGGTAVLLRGPDTPVATAPPVMAVGPDAPPVLTASATFDAAVADLARVLDERRDRLDSTTVRVLEQSLATIDRAIAEARAALATDPNDPYLNAHLVETMRRKLNLMRRAVTLVAES